MLDKIADEELVKLVQQGELLNFEILVRRYQGRLTAFCQMYTGDRTEAEEVVEEAFVKVYKNIERVDTGRKFSTFLFEVAKNTAIDRARKKGREIPLKENVANEEDEPWETIAREEKAEEVRRAMESLPQKYRKVLRLFYFDNLEYEEISRKLKIPLNTVRTHLKRGREKLKYILDN